MAKAEPPKKPAEKEPAGDEKATRKPQADSARPPAPAVAPQEEQKPEPPEPANENKPAEQPEPEKTPANENAPQPEKPEAKKTEEKKEEAKVPEAEKSKDAKPAAPQEERQPAEAQQQPQAGEKQESEKKGLKQKIVGWVKDQFADKEGEEKRSMKAKVFEKGVDAVGFGDILRAWRSPENRVRNVLKSIGSKAADMVAGRIVSMTFRMIAVTWVAGIIGGVSTFGGLALLALATGAASGLYTYSKDYLHDRFYGPKQKRKDVKLFDKGRLLNAGIAFGTGTLMGALGAWLAKTGIIQNLFAKIGDAVFGGIEAGKGAVTEAFNMSAAPPEKTMPLAVPPVSHAFAAALHPAAIPVVADTPAPVAASLRARPGLALS